jgi:hypothetical protein
VSVALRGTSTNALVTIDRTAIDFGTVGCTRGGSAPITIGNAGPTLTSYRASLVGSLNPALALVFPTGDIPSDFSVTVPLFCSATLAPGAYASDLTVSVNAGSITRHIPVTATIERADIALSATEIDLGTVHAGVPITRTVDVRNTGNVATAVRAEGSLAVSLSPASFQLAAGASATVVATIVPSAEDIGRGRVDLGFGIVDGDCNGAGIEVLGSVVP